MMRLIQLSKKLNFNLYSSAMENNLQIGLQEFREHLGGELTIMLLEKIGKGIEVHEIDKKAMLKAISILKSF